MGKNQVKSLLADGDALVLSTEKLLKILKVLFETFPKLQKSFFLCGTEGYSEKIR